VRHFVVKPLSSSPHGPGNPREPAGERQWHRSRGDWRRVHATLKRQALAAGLKPANHERVLPGDEGPCACCSIAMLAQSSDAMMVSLRSMNAISALVLRSLRDRHDNGKRIRAAFALDGCDREAMSPPRAASPTATCGKASPSFCAVRPGVKGSGSFHNRAMAGSPPNATEPRWAPIESLQGRFPLWRIGQISAAHAAFALRLQARLPGSFVFRGPLRVHSHYGPVTSNRPKGETLSMGFRASVSLHPAIQATGRPDFTPAGLIPAEHTSLRWTHKRTQFSIGFSVT
jgi:hypothetical protein